MERPCPKKQYVLSVAPLTISSTTTMVEMGSIRVKSVDNPFPTEILFPHRCALSVRTVVAYNHVRPHSFNGYQTPYQDQIAWRDIFSQGIIAFSALIYSIWALSRINSSFSNSVNGSCLKFFSNLDSSFVFRPFSYLPDYYNRTFYICVPIDKTFTNEP